jgi:transposase InsO family protein
MSGNAAEWWRKWSNKENLFHNWLRMPTQLSGRDRTLTLYLAIVMHLFSRKVVGWSAGPTIHRELVLHLVPMAVRK